MIDQITEQDILCGLVKARKLITDKKHWCVGARHRVETIRTGFLGLRREKLEQFCALGAIDEATGSPSPLVDPLSSPTPLARGVRSAVEKHTTRPIWSVNDHYGHAAVLDAFDKAIQEIDPDYRPGG